MLTTLSYSFPRYLAAKKVVDDRSINRRVWGTLARQLARPRRQPWRILEIGAGIGTMLERTLEWNLFWEADYTAVDAMEENVEAAVARFPDWAAQHGFHVNARAPRGWQLHTHRKKILARFETADLFDFACHRAGERWDLLIAHAFMDLMNVPETLPVLFDFLDEGGLFYFSLNFDGLTLFEPVLDPILDEKIQSLYHQTMDERLTAGRPSGDSRAGRRMFTHLKDCGADILDAGSSDWVVFAGSEGYPEDAEYFLHFLIDTVRSALEGQPELDAAELANWVAIRHAQIERGELVYIAHQLDIVGRRPA